MRYLELSGLELDTRDKQRNKTVKEIGCLSIKLPESSSTENQTVHNTLDFSGTDLELKTRACFNHDRSSSYHRLSLI